MRWVQWVSGSLWYPYELEGWNEAATSSILSAAPLTVPAAQLAKLDSTTELDPQALSQPSDDAPLREHAFGNAVIILVYGKDPEAAQSAAEALQKWNYRKVCVLLGGIETLLKREKAGNEGSGGSCGDGDMVAWGPL